MIAKFETRADLALIVPPGGYMIELGVAAGDFATRLMRRNPEAAYIGIDRYSDHHGEDEYLAARARIDGLGGALLRESFDSANQWFCDDYAHLIYVDGYAHTGQEGGQTLRDWWPKVRPGGVFAGHDYCARWRQTMAAVDEFVAARGLVLHVIDDKPCASWWVRKPNL